MQMTINGRSLLSRCLAVMFYGSFVALMLRMAYVGNSHGSLRAVDLYALWVIAVLGWTRSWVDGVFYPLFMKKQGKETEFVVIQTVTGLFLVGLFFLIATAGIE